MLMQEPTKSGKYLLPPGSTRRGTKLIVAMRLALALALICVICLEGGLGYTFLFQLEENKLLAQLQSGTAELKEAIQTTLELKIHAASAVGTVFRYAHGGLSVFDDFSNFAKEQANAAKLRNIYLLPLVTRDERESFEGFLSENWERLAGPELRDFSETDRQRVKAVFDRGITDFEILPVSKGSNARVNYSYYAAGEPSLGAAPAEYGPFYAVVTRTYPLRDAWPTTGRDHHDDAVRQRAIDLVLNTGAPACTDFTQLLQDVTLGVIRAASGIYAPIFDRDGDVLPASADGGALRPRITGVVFAIFNWHELITQSLPTFVNSYDIVARSPMSTYSFHVDSQGAHDVGRGAIRSQAGDKYRTAFSVAAGGLSLEFEIYPTQQLLDAFLTSLPRNLVVAITVTLFGCFLLFVAFDVANRRLVSKLVVVAAHESAKAEMEAELQSSRNVFVSMVSHEIRTPASTIIGALDVLRDSRLTKPQREMCGIISSASADILSLVEDALAVGEGGEAGFKIANARTNLRTQLLERSFRTARMQERFKEKVSKIQMTLKVAEDVPKFADIDAGRAGQVFTNLIGNAIKFCNIGGSIACAVDLDEGGSLRIRVKDSGIGLSPEGQNRLFKPFSQAEGAQTRAKYGGTGLGLLISRNICRSMGGDLSVFSAGLGTGCEFTAVFALLNPGDSSADRPSVDADSTKRSSQLSRASSDSEAFAQGKGRATLQGADVLPPVHEGGQNGSVGDALHVGKRISVVGPFLRAAFAEDDALLRRVTSMMLKTAQFDVVVFPEGASLYEAVEKNPGSFDLILLDANMGGGDLDGLPTLRRLVSFFAQLDSLGDGETRRAPPPVVLLTGETQPEVHAEFLEAGAARVITKPAGVKQFNELRQMVNLQHSLRNCFPGDPWGTGTEGPSGPPSFASALSGAGGTRMSQPGTRSAVGLFGGGGSAADRSRFSSWGRGALAAALAPAALAPAALDPPRGADAV